MFNHSFNLITINILEIQVCSKMRLVVSIINIKEPHLVLYLVVLLWHFIYQQAVSQCCSRLLISSKGRDLITHMLASLHWLPVSFMIDFKIWLITFSACEGLAPSYILHLLTIYETFCSLWGPRGGAVLVLALLHWLKQCSPSNHVTRHSSALSCVCFFDILCLLWTMLFYSAQ